MKWCDKDSCSGSCNTAICRWHRWGCGGFSCGRIPGKHGDVIINLRHARKYFYVVVDTYVIVIVIAALITTSSLVTDRRWLWELLRSFRVQ